MGNQEDFFKVFFRRAFWSGPVGKRRRNETFDRIDLALGHIFYNRAPHIRNRVSDSTDHTRWLDPCDNLGGLCPESVQDGSEDTGSDQGTLTGNGLDRKGECLSENRNFSESGAGFFRD